MSGLTYKQLDAAIAIEGAVDHCIGRPLDENPWARHLEIEWESWRCGWLDASLMLTTRERREPGRWRSTRA
jgi:hypothetical protein